MITESKFQQATVGWDRCEECCKIKPLVIAYDMDIGKLLEIMPDGRWTYICYDCVNTPGRQFVLR